MYLVDRIIIGVFITAGMADHSSLVCQHPVLLTEALLNPRSNQDMAPQIMFETFNLPALYNSIQAVLFLYASGRTTGVVLEARDGVSQTVPVYEGFAMPSSIRRIDVARRDVTEYMQLLVRKSGYVFHTSAAKEVVRLIKEMTCYVALDSKMEKKEWTQSGGRPEGKILEYQLPDSNKIKVWDKLLWRLAILLHLAELLNVGWSGEISSARNSI